MNLASGKKSTITGGDVDVASPTFSRDGKLLFFAGSTNSGPIQVGLNMSSQERPYRAGLYAAVLAADGESPLLPDSGDENAEGEDEGKEKDKNDGEKEEEVPETIIDLDGLADRIVGLPVAKKNYGRLAVAGDGNLYFLDAVQPGASVQPPGDDEGAENELARYNFEEKEVQTVLAGVEDYDLSANGKHLLIAKSDDSLVVADVGEKLEPEPLDLAGVRLRVDPRVEWRQIFDEAWRMEREYFYAENLHGLDWQAVYTKYRPLVEHVGRREDLNALMVLMIAEMQAGHNRVGGGDVHREANANTGLLGANFVVEDGRYRIARIYTGESWNPFLMAPLATPGSAAQAGEFLLAINGRDLTAADNLFEQLQGTAGQQVRLLVGPRADGRAARNIVVEPVGDERQMRLWSWIENNRRIVDEATDGRVGYVYLPNTAGAGYTFFNRMFFAQVDKEAMIIDERSNSGGQAANYITDVLSRRHLSGWKDRSGLTFRTPAGAVHGPKLMLIDQDAGSGGDYLPWSFRHLGIGKLMGTRTWGGLIGIYANPSLIDGGVITVPHFRFFDPDGNWSVENEGVAPDIEVELDPIATNRGEDSQLSAAIKEILRQLETYEPALPRGAPPLPTELGQ
jgi:tricorn protease